MSGYLTSVIIFFQVLCRMYLSCTRKLVA